MIIANYKLDHTKVQKILLLSIIYDIISTKSYFIII